MTEIEAKPKAREKKAECADPKCPFHGGLKIRGASYEGIVVGAKGLKTVVVELSYFRRVRKYERYEKRRSRIRAHVPACLKVKEGDRVRIAECRKLSKTKAHVVTEVVK